MDDDDEEETITKKLEIIVEAKIRYLRSSPTGPAEHCAGGSLPRSCSSCERKDKNDHDIQHTNRTVVTG